MGDEGAAGYDKSNLSRWLGACHHLDKCIGPFILLDATLGNLQAHSMQDGD
jgi:hypothetical protein